MSDCSLALQASCSKAVMPLAAWRLTVHHSAVSQLNPAVLSDCSWWQWGGLLMVAQRPARVLVPLQPLVPCQRESQLHKWPASIIFVIVTLSLCVPCCRIEDVETPEASAKHCYFWLCNVISLDIHIAWQMLKDLAVGRFWILFSWKYVCCSFKPEGPWRKLYYSLSIL